MGGLLLRPVARWTFFAGVLFLLVGSCSLFYFGAVKLKVLPFDKPSNPYGLNLTLMIIVKVKGPSGDATPQNLTLDVSAPAGSDEATGDHPAWQKQMSRSVWSAGEKGVASFLFVMPYECSSGTTFVASIGPSKKTVKQPLGCAE